MELKELHPRRVIPGFAFLTDRANRRIPGFIRGHRTLMNLNVAAHEVHDAKEDEDEAKRDRDEGRNGTIIPLAKKLEPLGVHGVWFEGFDQPILVWWYRSVSWRITDFNRFVRSKAFRSNAKAREAVELTWTAEQLGGAEGLEKMKALFGPDIIEQAKKSIKKDPFQKASGAKRPPVGTQEVEGQWSVKTAPDWPDEESDEQD